MRLARNFALLLMLLVAPFAANFAMAAEAAIVGPTCGDCTCSEGQCCDKSWAGGCSCYTCEDEIEVN